MDNHIQPGKRNLRGNQPARALLVDLSHCIDRGVWQRLLSTLHSLMSIVCNLAGPARIPLITIYLLDAYPEVMLPFCPVKGNLCRVLTALRDMRGLIEDSLRSAVLRPASCLAQGIAEACGQYRRHLNALGQLQGRGNVQLDQLEIVFVSGASQTSVQTQLVGQNMDFTHLKRLVAVLLNTTTADADSESPHSSISHCKDSEDPGSLIDFVYLDADETSLQRFFYTWLQDNSSDNEHLHLCLPPPSPADKELSIKCDILERIVNPAQLPHHEFFSLHPDSSHCKMVFPCPSKAAGLTVPIYKLCVIATLPAEAICDSLVFGLPLLVQATSCWRIDWEDLEANTANFHSLCQELRNKNFVLLVQLDHCLAVSKASSSSTATGNKCRSQQCCTDVRPLFVLVPGPNSTLLLKALATRELVLPASWPASFAEPPVDSVLRVQSALTQVPSLDSFNPMLYTSGLVQVLLAQAEPKQQAVRPRPAVKRKAPVKEPDVQDHTWSGLPTPSLVTSTSVFIGGQSARSRGGQPVAATPRADHQHPPANMCKSRLPTKRSDGFLLDLE